MNQRAMSSGGLAEAPHNAKQLRHNTKAACLQVADEPEVTRHAEDLQAATNGGARGATKKKSSVSVDISSAAMLVTVGRRGRKSSIASFRKGSL